MAALPELSSPRGLEKRHRQRRMSFSRDWLFPFEDGARVAAVALIALAGVVLVWSRLMMLTQSLFGDEAFSIVRYIEPGPGAIWSASNWLPNDHMLFEFVTWATTRLLGSHTEPVYRLWSVLPGIAASGLIAWWLWDRDDRWAAAIFTVLATGAPIYFDLGTQARGYGLSFLASAMILVGADRLQRSEGRSRAALVLFGGGGFVGMATLETFLGPFLATALVLLLRPSLRRAVIVMVALVGVATLAWYAPVLSKSLGYQNPNGRPLPWYGFVQAPLRDLLGAGVNLLAPGVSVTAGAIASAVVLAIGGVATWFRRERMLVLVLLAPVLGTFLLLELASAKYAPRFGAFALLPLLTLGALGLATIFRVPARATQARAVMPVLIVCLSVVVLGRFVHYAAAFSETPYEDAKTAGQIIRGAEQTDPGRPIVADYALAAFNSYVSPEHVRTLSTADLVHMFCTFPGSFIYLEHGATRTLPDTSCLTQRDSTQIALPERREKESVWLVPPLK